MTGALISLLNEQRFAKNMPAMGFLNPFLYKNADCFTDIVKGTNAIGRGGQQLKYGYAAAEGWDAATGLGTPVFSKLSTAALAAGERAIKN
jgi:tripeptidyl-peptidase-1